MNSLKPPTFPLMNLAFRPLFLFGSIFSVIAISWWSYFWLNPNDWSPYGGLIWWHAHEMLFGFGTAIVTGFLLTAVRNWTGVPGISGALLASLVTLWLLGRLVISFTGELPWWAISSIDVSYLLFAATALAYPIIKVKQWRNLMFVPILLLLALLNAISHWSVISNQPEIAIKVIHATIILFTLIIAIIGGRVMPMFTANGAGCKKKNPIMWLEIISIFSILSMVTIALVGFNQINPMLLFCVSSISAIANAIRFSRWGIQYTWSIPLLWSLHLSYIFIPLGFALLAFYSIGWITNLSAVLHSFTVGAVGGMILAMISRVSLGHTGRSLKAHKLLSLAYALIVIATLIRVFIPAWFPSYYNLSIGISGSFWTLAFVFFVVIYAPILISERADGRPG